MQVLVRPDKLQALSVFYFGRPDGDNKANRGEPNQVNRRLVGTAMSPREADAGTRPGLYLYLDIF